MDEVFWRKARYEDVYSGRGPASCMQKYTHHTSNLIGKNSRTDRAAGVKVELIRERHDDCRRIHVARLESGVSAMFPSNPYSLDKV